MIPSEEQQETLNSDRTSASTPPKTDLVELLNRHAELAKLEFQMEMADATRRLGLFFFAGLVFAIGFCFLQVTIFMGLVSIGLPIWASSLLLGLIYIVFAVFLTMWCARRNSKLGTPFAGSAEELKRTLEWIQKRFS